jgi:dienelactone hydrolase
MHATLFAVVGLSATVLTAIAPAPLAEQRPAVVRADVLDAVEKELDRLAGQAGDEPGPAYPRPSSEVAFLILTGLAAQGAEVLDPPAADLRQLGVEPAGNERVQLFAISGDACVVVTAAVIQDKAGSWTSRQATLYRRQGGKWTKRGNGTTAVESVSGAPPDAVFDLPAILAPPLQARTLTKREAGGIVTEEVMFHSETDGDTNVEIFAFFSYPQDARGLPAYIWNQGGLGQAAPDRTESGARRGYATLCIDFPLPGYRSTGGYEIRSGLEVGDDPKTAPIYHGAVALLRAVSFLESRPEVDKARIGMAGSSWGGFFTTLMVGVDPRLKAGSCLYGCGRLDLGNWWWDGRGWNANAGPAYRNRWRTTLDPAWRLAARETPVAWFTGTNDVFYWLPSVMASYEAAAGPKHLSLLPNLSHPLTPQLEEQVFAWLDVHLKGAPPFTTVSPLVEAESDGTLEARWTFSGPRKIARADLLLSHGEEGNWLGRHWRTIPATIQDDTCVARLPRGGFPYLVIGQVIDEDGFRSATTMRRIERELSEEPPDYDGCSDWGGFEEEHIAFLKRHGLGAPPVTSDAHEGRQAAALEPGQTMLRPVHYTSGWPHRLSLSLKAKSETRVTIALDGRFDDQPQRARKVVTAGPEWTAVTLDFTPAKALTGNLVLFVTSPRGSEVRVDAVEFRPRLMEQP